MRRGDEAMRGLEGDLFMYPLETPRKHRIIHTSSYLVVDEVIEACLNHASVSLIHLRPSLGTWRLAPPSPPPRLMLMTWRNKAAHWLRRLYETGPLTTRCMAV